MSQDKIRISADEITQALEDARTKYAQPEVSQTEKSRRAVLEEIRSMIAKHPEMSSKEIALETGATPKQVSAQRYLMKARAEAAPEQRAERKHDEAAGEAIKTAVEAQPRHTVPEAAEGDLKADKAETGKETCEAVKAEIKPLTAPEGIAEAMACEVPRQLIDDAAEALIRVVRGCGVRPMSCDAFICADSVRLSVLLESGEAIG